MSSKNKKRQKRQYLMCQNRLIVVLIIFLNHEIYNQMLSNIVLIILVGCLQAQYNHQTSTYLNTTWMSLLDNGIPIRKLTIIGSHSSMGTGAWGDAFQTQSNSLMGQMKMGVRALDIRCRHYNNQFPIHDRLVYLNTDLGAVLSTVSSFLQTYPMETILMHIVEEYNPSGNSRTFEQTFISYKNLYSSVIWVPTSQNPVLGQVRGKIVIIQDFSGVSIHGLMYSTFTVLPHKWYNTNWDQYDKWTAVKSFLSASNTAGDSRLSFWTGHGGSFPYFVASGKSSPGNSSPRLATGLTTPGFSSSYPDFPRVACFIGICTIAFEGINILGYNYINNNNLKYLGIVFTDFLGDPLLQKAVSINVGKFTPCPSTLLTQGCTFCSSTGQCLGCNTTNHYVYNLTSSSCLADKGYYLDWSTETANVAVNCSTLLVGCLECTSATACTVCNSLNNYQLINGSCTAAPGYYLDSSSVPVKCNLDGCYQCASASVCTTCSTSTNFIMDVGTQTCVCDSSRLFVLSPSSPVCICQAGYYLNSSNLCDTIPLCPTNNSGCLSCSFAPTNSCSTCDAANNFETAIFDPAYCTCKSQYYFDGNTCNACSNNLTSACLSCASSSICLSCKANFTLFYGGCVCLPQYYLSGTDTCLQCEVGCLRCTGGSSCTTCDIANNFTLVSNICQCNPGMFLSQGKCEPCGAMPGCLTCSQTGCTSCSSMFGFSLNITIHACQCNYGFFINAMSICETCTQLGCLNCLSLSNCIQCDTNFFYLSAGVCNDICGDGQLYTLPCDDGNTVNGDGCSSTCSVEQDYTCVGGTTTTPSMCSYSGPIIITITSFIKDPTKNMVYLQSSISPNLTSLALLDFNAVFKPLFPVETTNTVYDPTTGNISTTFTYNSSLNSQQLAVQFTPPATPAYFYMPTVNTVLPYSTDNNLALKVYSSDEYELVSTIGLLTYIIAYSSLALFVICFLIVSKLMAIQMIFIYQLTYAALILLKKLELFMDPLKNLWIVNGYNNMVKDQSSQLPGRVSGIFYKGYFLSNFSIDIIVVLLPIIVGALCLLVGKIGKSKGNRIRAYRILKQWLLSSLLFVQMHLNISISLGVEYSSQKMVALAIGGVIELLLIFQLCLYIKRPKNFGEYTEFFNLVPTDQRWYIFVFVCRTVIAFLIGFLGQMTYGMYAALGIGLLSLLAQLIKRPYLSNIRPAVNCIFIVSILALYTVNKVFQDSQSTSIYTSYTPFMLIAVLLLALVFNAVCMIAHFVSKSRKGNKTEKSKEIMDQNEAQSKHIDKVYINEIKENLKDALMVNKKIDLKVRQSQSDEHHKLDRLKIRKEFLINQSNNVQSEMVEYSAVRCRLNSDSDDRIEVDVHAI